MDYFAMNSMLIMQNFSFISRIVYLILSQIDKWQIAVARLIFLHDILGFTTTAIMSTDSITSIADKVTKDGSSGYKVEKGRYHLYVSLGCPYAHR